MDNSRLIFPYPLFSVLAMQELLESFRSALHPNDSSSFNIDLSSSQWIRMNENKIASLKDLDFYLFVYDVSGILFSKSLPYSCDALAELLQNQLYAEKIDFSSDIVLLTERLHEYALHASIDFAENERLPESGVVSESVLAITMPKSAGTFISAALRNRGVYNYTGHLIGQASYNRLSRPRLNVMSALGLQVTHSHVCPSLFNAYAVRASSISKIWIHLRSRLDHVLESLVRMAQLESHLFVKGDAKSLLDGIKDRRILDDDPSVINFLSYYRSFYCFWRSFALRPINGKSILLTYFEDFKSDPVEVLGQICDFYGASRLTETEYHELAVNDGHSLRYNVGKQQPVSVRDLFSEAFLAKLSIPIQ